VTPLSPATRRPAGAGPCGDFSDLPPLAGAAHTVLPFDQLLADAGYDSEANHREAATLQCADWTGAG
jgi:hypothetical protein